MSKTPIISVHIPKTAGTSITRSYSAAFGAGNVMLDYMGDTYTADRHVTNNKVLSRTRKVARSFIHYVGLQDQFRKLIKMTRAKSSTQQVDQYIKVIHGHFQVTKYSNQYPDSPKVVVFRDPLERMWSNYKHWQRVPESEVANDWYRTSMAFEEFALHPMNHNYQTSLIAPFTPADFDVFGRSDNLTDFLKRFKNLAEEYYQQEFNFPEFSENISQNSSLPNVSEDFVVEFKRVNQTDYDFFNF